MLTKSSKIISLLLCFLLLFEQSGFSQIAGQVDLSGYIIGQGNPAPTDKYRPLHLRYLSYNNQNNSFKLLLDKGDYLKEVDSRQKSVDSKKNLLLTTDYLLLNNETQKLLQYFFIGLIIPNESFWVNLRPDSPDNIIDPELSKTDIGRILLEADVQLKKDTALYTSPQTKEGRQYWDKLYKKAEELYGYQTVDIPTLTRPWIVPGEIIIRETNDDGRLKMEDGKRIMPSAYIYKATLKVMLEEEYLRREQKNIVGTGLAPVRYEFKDSRAKELNRYSTELIRELIIPKITQEVNTSRKYAKLMQVYYSLILAQWFKQRLDVGDGLVPARNNGRPQGSPLHGTEADSSPTNYANLINSSNLTGLTSQTPWSKDTYYQQYQKSFKDGEYSFKQPVRTPFGQTIRSYFSGGMSLVKITASSSGIVEQGISSIQSFGLPVTRDNLIEIIYDGNGVVSSAVEKKRIWDKEINRRDFLIGILSAIIGGAVVGDLLLPQIDLFKEQKAINIETFYNETVANIGDKRIIKFKDLKFKKRKLLEILFKKDKNFIKKYLSKAILREQKILNKSIPLSGGMSDMVERAMIGNADRDLRNLLEINLHLQNYQSIKNNVFFTETLGHSSVLSFFNAIIIFLGSPTLISLPYLLIHEGIHFNSQGFPFAFMNEGLTQLLTVRLLIQKENYRPNLSNPTIEKSFKEHGIEVAYLREQLSIDDLSIDGYLPNLIFVLDLIKKIKQEELIQAFLFADYSPRLKNLFNDKMWERLIGLGIDEMDDDISKLTRRAKQAIEYGLAVEKKEVFSGSAISSSALNVDDKGGIDFRFLPIVTQAMTNLSANISSSAISRLSSINLDIEWQKIKQMAGAGIRASSQRIKEYVQAACLKESIVQLKDKIILYISDILRLEEELCIETDCVLRDILVVLESVREIGKLKAIFVGR